MSPLYFHTGFLQLLIWGFPCITSFIYQYFLVLRTCNKTWIFQKTRICTKNEKLSIELFDKSIELLSEQCSRRFAKSPHEFYVSAAGMGNVQEGSCLQLRANRRNIVIMRQLVTRQVRQARNCSWKREKSHDCAWLQTGNLGLISVWELNFVCLGSLQLWANRSIIRSVTLVQYIGKRPSNTSAKGMSEYEQ